MMPPPARVPEPDDNHEVVGWDAAPQGKDFTWREQSSPPQTPRLPRRRWWLPYAILAAVLGLLLLL